ncbi:MAG: NADP transhydrogenase subunit alpha [Chromatiales bacterium]|nr:MAG: NADP transhydrogenase subunit alpha [Chromatiales bacterium]
MGGASTVTRIAIVGAGLSGLVVARRLQDHADVTVFEKSRSAGGRMATRYAGEFEFDHGAQFFTARSERFRRFLQPLIDAGAVANWQARFAEYDGSSLSTLRAWGDDYPHYVGTPRMNSIGKMLSANLDIVFETEITGIARGRDGWVPAAGAGNESGPFDWLVMTSPAAQTAALVEGFDDFSAFCDERRMLGCLALMLGFAKPVDLPWDAALVRNADISWISVNSSKPARDSAFSLLVHSTNAWADAHLEDDTDFILDHMLDEASRVAGEHLRSAAHRQVHRWRYANIDTQAGPTCFVDDGNQLAACGDWCVRGRIEAAFTSASDLAESLIARL